MAAFGDRYVQVSPWFNTTGGTTSITTWPTTSWQQETTYVPVVPVEPEPEREESPLEWLDRRVDEMRLKAALV